MPLPTPDQVIKDPDFLGLPNEEKHKVLMAVDKDYRGLPQEEQVKVVNKLTASVAEAYPGGKMLDHPVSKEEARRIASEELIKKERAAGHNDIVSGAEIGHPEAVFATPTGILPQIVSNTRSALKSVPLVGLVSEGGFKGVEEGAKALAPTMVNPNIDKVGRDAMDKNFGMSNVASETLGQIPTAFVAGPAAASKRGWDLIKAGGKAGALFGGQGALQADIQEHGIPTTTEEAERLAANTATGVGTGMIVGGGIPVGGMVLKKVGGVLSKVPTLLKSKAANLAREEAKQAATESLTEEAIASVKKKAPPNVKQAAPGDAPPLQPGEEPIIDPSKPTKLNTEPKPEVPVAEPTVPDEAYMPSDAKVEAKKVAQVKSAVKNAVDQGVPNDHTSDLIKMNDQERGIAAKLAKAGEQRAVGDPSAPSPEQIQGMVGEEIRKPIVALGQLRKQAGQELGQLFDNIPDVPVHDLPVGKRPVDHILAELQNSELKGLKISPDGSLDFSRTTLKGPDSAGARKTIEMYLEQIKGETPFQLHLTRQELFEVLGGKKLAQVQLNSSEEKAIEGIRKGLANFLEHNVTGYKAANQKYAKIMTPLKTLNRVFKYGNLEDAMAANQDVLDEGAGVLARRLTSNYKSRAEIKQAFEQINAVLKDNGIENKVRPEHVQSAYNIVASHYPQIVPKGSFQNLITEGVKTAVPMQGRSLSEMTIEGLKAVGKDLLPIHQSDATRQKALQDLIDALGADTKGGAPLVVPSGPALANPKPKPLQGGGGALGEQFY